MRKKLKIINTCNSYESRFNIKFEDKVEKPML